MRLPLALLVLFGVLLAAGCGASQRTALRPSQDPPRLVPWRGEVGRFTLGESAKRVVATYGRKRRGGVYSLHGRKLKVFVGSGRVQEIDVSTPYYRTSSGVGVGSRIAHGPCVRTLAAIGSTPCGHRWHGFLWNDFTKETACGCWVKVGLGKMSLRPSVSNFLKPWLFFYLRGGRVSDLRFVLHFVD